MVNNKICECCKTNTSKSKQAMYCKNCGIHVRIVQQKITKKYYYKRITELTK